MKFVWEVVTIVVLWLVAAAVENAHWTCVRTASVWHASRARGSYIELRCVEWRRTR